MVSLRLTLLSSLEWTDCGRYVWGSDHQAGRMKVERDQLVRCNGGLAVLARFRLALFSGVSSLWTMNVSICYCSFKGNERS